MYTAGRVAGGPTTGPIQVGKMQQRSVSEQQFRRHVAKVRARFVDLYARDPEHALEDLLEDVGGLIRKAARLDTALWARKRTRRFPAS